MSRPDPIEYAERLYAAMRDANFSPISFLAFGNAVKEGVPFRNMPRVAAEPFMRIVGEMLEMEEEAAEDELPEAEVVEQAAEAQGVAPVGKPDEAATPGPDTIAGAPVEAPVAPAQSSGGTRRARR